MPSTCYQKALQLLATRAHFRRELAMKLTQRGYPAEEIAAALDRLTEQKYLDDRATARLFVESRRERTSEGRARLRSGLLQRGGPEGAVDAAPAGLTPGGDTPPPPAAAGRRRVKGGGGPPAPPPPPG